MVQKKKKKSRPHLVNNAVVQRPLALVNIPAHDQGGAGQANPELAVVRQLNIVVEGCVQDGRSLAHLQQGALSLVLHCRTAKTVPKEIVEGG